MEKLGTLPLQSEIRRRGVLVASKKKRHLIKLQRAGDFFLAFPISMLLVPSTFVCIKLDRLVIETQFVNHSKSNISSLFIPVRTSNIDKNMGALSFRQLEL